MQIARQVVEVAHAQRKEAKIKVRQPLSSLIYSGSKKLDRELEQIIAEEINVKKVIYKKGAKIKLNTQITPKLKAEGWAREIIRKIQDARKQAACKLDEKITVHLQSWPKEFEDYIKQETLTKSLIRGPSLVIERNSAS